jgi:ABC-type hemin transport system substrate-binding protein
VLGHTWRIDAAYQLLNLDAVDAEISQIGQLAGPTARAERLARDVEQAIQAADPLTAVASRRAVVA